MIHKDAIRRIPVLFTLLAILFAAGCGGGGATGRFPNLTPQSSGQRENTVQGVAYAPSGVSLGRGAERSAAIQGLNVVRDGTPVAIYRIDDEGRIVGDFIVSGQTRSRNF